MDMVFGERISAQDITSQMAFFDDWEEKYAFIIDLGKQLPYFNPEYQTEENVVKGCQSLVWITYERRDNVFVFNANSDALIVKGLLAIILAAYNNKTASEIIAFDITLYFSELDLLNHISNVRGNGLNAMVGNIQAIAKNSL